MQLPRGSFYRIFKGITQSSLYQEMQQSGFTGTCTIATAAERGVLVVEGGQIVLAEFRSSIGQAALDEMRKFGEVEVSAELNAFTAAQMKLAREFNPGFGTQPPATQGSRKMPVKEILPGKSRNPRDKPPSSSTVIPVRAYSSPKRTLKTRPETANPAAGITGSAVPADGSGEMPENPSLPLNQAGVAAPVGDDMNMLVERMEKMDVEMMISSFRGNCKDMLMRMQLDHLIRDAER
jgi:hypothetical protein